MLKKSKVYRICAFRILPLLIDLCGAVDAAVAEKKGARIVRELCRFQFCPSLRPALVRVLEMRRFAGNRRK